MSWKGITVVLLAAFGSSLCLSEIQRKCVETFDEELSNDFLLGTWYFMVKFILFGSLVPTTRCSTSILQKANTTEIERYKNEYWTADIPYSFDDNPLHEHEHTGFQPEGLVIGNKQAKFHIMDPATHFHRPLYELRVYQRLTDDFVLYHDCTSRGNVMWLLSKKRNPTNEELQAIIQTRPELVRMDQHRHCSPI
ncbi:uncharacterized protein [Epargyreus clarus]|uniref:uncharacterized protein n=1 Tax=Epargyreus clarus TaxID=520877 RepID=UPI003C2CE425